MNKIKYLIIAVLTVGFVQAQDELNLPNYTPPSPEASAMTKYADLQANEFKGIVSHTIPLYTYKAGQLEVPISISYNGAGVRVDDIPTWVGINWTLNAGGVITRTVKDLPDENVMQRLMPTEADIVDYNAVADGTPEGNFLWNVAESSQQIDSEVDLFQFNFNGYSGSFYLDANWIGRPLNDDQNLKITVVDRNQFYNQKFIYITTPDGVKYTFGGQNATEETSLRYVVNGSMTPGDTNLGTTAYYLISIEDPIYGEVNFEYESLNIEILTTQKIQKLRKTLQYEYYLHHGNCGGEIMSSGNGVTTCLVDPLLFDCTNREEIDDKFSTVTISSRVLNPKYLKKISSFQSSEIIEFNSERVDNPSFKRVLNSIVIDKDGNGPLNAFKTIDFEYYGFSPNPNFPATTRYAEKRFFLTKIIFDKGVNYAVNTQNGRRNQVYEFEYNSLSGLPNRFSYSQDFGGYFNDISNTTSVPDNITFNPFGLHNLADRTPNFNYAKFGSLKRIYYPTGGYTEFDYESARKAKKENHQSINLFTYRNFNDRIPRNKLNDGVPQVLPEEQGGSIGIFDVYETQSVSINVLLRAYLTTGTPLITAQNEKATLIVTDRTTNTVIKTQLFAMNSATNNLSNGGIVEKSFSTNVSFIEGHDYGIDLQLHPTDVPLSQQTTTSPIPLEGLLSLSYYDGFTIVDDFGVRLKRMTDYAKDGQPENIKRYYYSTIEDANTPIDLNSLPILGEGNLYTKIDNYTSNKICIPNTSQCICDLPPTWAELWYYHTELLSETINFNNTPHLSNYEYVTVSLGGDSFERGGIEKRYRLADDYGGTKIYTDLNGSATSFMHFFMDELTNNSMNVVRIANPMNGVLLHEKFYKKESGSVKKISFNDYVYTTIEDNVVRNIFAKKEYNALFYGSGSQNENNTISNYTLAVYKIPSLRNELSQKQTIEYIDPVPLGVTDESSFNKIVSIEDYNYGFYKGLPTKITSNTSDGSLVEINNYYVDELYNPIYQTGLTTEQIDAVQALHDKNIINSPILTEKVRNSKKISRIKKIYKDLDSNPNFDRIVPHIIQSDKGDELGTSYEDRVVFHEYDNSGRPTLVSLANGTKTKYWYNALGQVILKADNYVPGAGGMITEADIIQQTNNDPCYYMNVFSNETQVTIYKYEPGTALLIEIIDPKCNSLKYIYDDLHRLQMIKDKDENILQEFDLSFKRY